MSYPLAVPLPLLTRSGRGPRLARHPILVVDDNRDAANSLAAVLRLAGADVEVCYNGSAALELVEQLRPSFVFLDLVMPGMDGYEVARRIRRMEAGAHLRLIALTGWTDTKYREHSRRAGFDHFLLKPAPLSAIQASMEPLRH